MLSRRTLLKTGGATLALLPYGDGFARAPAARPGSIDAASGANQAGALVAQAPELLRGRHAANALHGARGPAQHLRAAGLVGFALEGEPGSAPYDESVAAIRERIGDRRLGLIWWGGTAGQAVAPELNDAAAAVVLIDQVALAGGRYVSERGVLCHFASRRSTEDRRAIELQLAAVERTGSPLIYHWYDAKPGFAAPGRRDAAADLVWQRTAWFLGRALAQSACCGLPGAAYGGAWA